MSRPQPDPHRNTRSTRPTRKRMLWVAALLAATLIGVTCALDTFDGLRDRVAAYAGAAPTATPLPPTATPIPPTPTPLPPTATPLPTVNGYLTEVYKDTAGNSMTYYLHVPSGYDPRASTRYPVVLLLHGIGQDARSNYTVNQNRAAMLGDPYVQVWTSSSVQTQWPSFIVVPQLVSPHRWVSVPGSQGDYTLAPAPTPGLAMANAILARVEQEYARIDQQRVYITGISMGAYGVWDAVERWPWEFAAAAPVSGAGDPAGAAQLVHLPLWAYHRAYDTNVPVSGTRDMIAAMTAAGGSPCFTAIPGTDHDIWMLVYGDPNFMQWLFAQGTAVARQRQVPACVAPLRPGSDPTSLHRRSRTGP